MHLSACRSGLWLAALGVLMAQAGSGHARAAADPLPGVQPNILFLLTDDQRADTVHALGNPVIQTPNIDALAHSGFVFRNAYCMGGDRPAVCLPSRTMLLSGRSLFHLPELKAGSPSLPKSLRAAGYYTYHHGKRGNSPHQIHKDFDQSHYLKDDQAERRSGHPGREVADDAIAFLRSYKEQKPFFMHLAFSNPHDPRVVVDKYRKKYREADMPLPRNFLPLHPFNNGELLVRDEALAPWPRTPEVVRKHLTDYYGVITHLDMEIGRILQVLRATGRFENTVIVFASDQGLAVGSHGLFGKQNIYEDGMKVPLILTGPGIPKGESQALVYLFDLYPTLCDLAGAPVPASLDGKSLAPLLRGQASQARDTIFLAYRTYQRAVRQGPWKLIRYPQINKSQLFNLDDDPDEIGDLAGDARYAGKIEALMGLLKRQQQAFGDALELTSAHPSPAAVDASFFQRLKK